MTASDWGPDSPATTRFRAFYDWPAPVVFEATLPDDLDGPEDERQFLLDEAPFAKVAAVRVERADLPPSVAAPGRTPVPADTEEQDGAEALSGEAGCRCDSCGLRYRVDIHVPDSLWTRVGMTTPGGLLCGRCIADRLEQLGEFDAWALVRVSEDEATVDRVARALLSVAQPNLTWESADQFWRDVTRIEAHAAVRALREGGAS